MFGDKQKVPETIVSGETEQIYFNLLQELKISYRNSKEIHVSCLFFLCLSHTYLSVYPVCRWVLCVFHCKLYNSFSTEKAGAGAHRKPTHFLHTRDEKVHPENNTKSIYMNNRNRIFFLYKIQYTVW